MLTRSLAVALVSSTTFAVASTAHAQRSVDRVDSSTPRVIDRSGGAELGQGEVYVDEGGVAGVEPIERETVVPGGILTRPVQVTYAPGDYRRIFIVEQRVGNVGRARVYDLFTEQFLDSVAQPFFSVSNVTTGSEQGLLGMAFHPNHAENGHLFVYYTTSSGSVIRRYTVFPNDPNQVNPQSRKNILTFSQPATNHNGGWIGFGPDGYLYIATGDGGSGGDPWNNAQNLNTYLGKMLRINVDVSPDTIPYSIPADNPFVGQTGLDEIWSYGLRNPWRSSFDREYGDLYIGDVGQNNWEEVNFQHADSTGGENYGWKCYEGTANFSTGFCPGSPLLSWPFHSYAIFGQTRCSVIGGYVYRGCAVPSLRGTYFFGDYCPGHIFAMTYDRDGNVPAPSASPPASHPVSGVTNYSNSLGLGVSLLTSFGQDADGEIYFMSISTHAVYRIVPVTPTIKPADLTCSGVVNGFDLVELLADWGPCWGCKADLTGDGVVNGFDLVELLSEWGGI